MFLIGAYYIYIFFVLQIQYSNPEDGHYALNENKVWGLLHFSKNFSDSLANRFNDGTYNFDNITLDMGTIHAWIDNTSKIR